MKAIKDAWRGGFFPEEICRFACINSSPGAVDRGPLCGDKHTRLWLWKRGKRDKWDHASLPLTLCFVSVSSTDRFIWEGPPKDAGPFGPWCPSWRVISISSFLEKRKKNGVQKKPPLGRWTFNEVLGKKAARRQNVTSIERGPLKSTGMKLIPNVKRPKVLFECNRRRPTRC